jgi:hypothetical protein
MRIYFYNCVNQPIYVMETQYVFCTFGIEMLNFFYIIDVRPIISVPYADRQNQPGTVRVWIPITEKLKILTQPKYFKAVCTAQVTEIQNINTSNTKLL